jgi:signal transduction histidine kinase
VRRTDLIRSATFRLGLLATVFFVCSISIVYSLTYFKTASALGGLLNDDILSELSELKQQAEARGLDAVREAVELRMRDPVGTDNYYALLSPAGERLSGNLPISCPIFGWIDLPIGKNVPNGENSGLIVHARGDRIAGGAYLTVGRDRSDVDHVGTVFVQGFIVCASATIVLTLACSAFVASQVLARLAAIRGAAGEIVNGDLTRRIPTGHRGDEFDQLAGQLNAMLARLAALMGQLRQVTDDIAHDLRTPLARLRQRLELARRKARSVNEYENAVDGAIEAADAIITTFASLLRIAEVEAGTRRAGFVVLDLSRIAEAITDGYEPVAEDRGQHLRGQIQPGVLAFGERELLGQLLANLIDNALKHTLQGTRVTLQLRCSDAGTPEVEIMDNGPGIPPEMREQVFERFVRLDKSRTTAGSGLGLSLVAAIADLHGLTIALADAFPKQSRPGLRVALTFPTPPPVTQISAASPDQILPPRALSGG